jgi:hypothetical protein
MRSVQSNAPTIRTVNRATARGALEQLIRPIRGQRVILSHDLAALYGAETRALNQAVKRNPRRFPPQFMFRLTASELQALQRSRSRIVILKRGANIKYRPLAFTEHGAIMAATVLNSPRAVQMSIFVVQAFLRLRQWVASQSAFQAKLADLEKRVGMHDRELRAILDAIRDVFEPPQRSRRRIGFRAERE